MSVINKLKSVFTKSKSLERCIFAIREGSYKANFFVYINTQDDKHNFLVLPFNTVESVPVKEFEAGQKDKIVDLIEKLPHNVYEICCAQYNEAKAKSNINRLKQSTTQSGVDSAKRKT